MLRLLIEETHEDGTKEVHYDENVKSIACLVDSEDDERIGELIMHTNLMDMASKIAQSQKFSIAAELSQTISKLLKKMKGQEADDSENNLISHILGGMMQ